MDSNEELKAQWLRERIREALQNGDLLSKELLIRPLTATELTVLRNSRGTGLEKRIIGHSEMDTLQDSLHADYDEYPDEDSEDIGL